MVFFTKRVGSRTCVQVLEEAGINIKETRSSLFVPPCVTKRQSLLVPGKPIGPNLQVRLARKPYPQILDEAGEALPGANTLAYYS